MVDTLQAWPDRGFVFVRGGQGIDGEEPLRLVLPGRWVPTVVEALEQGGLDAEESYWQEWLPALQGHIGRPLAEAGEDVCARAAAELVSVEAWQQRAEQGRRVTGDPVLVLTGDSHVGLLSGPPYAPEASVAVMDPLQVRRVAGTLRAAGEAAAGSEPAGFGPSMVGEALAWVSALPWPPVQDAVPGRTLAERSAWMDGARVDFLRRSPFQRGPGTVQDLPE